MNYEDKLTFAQSLAREAGQITRDYFLSNNLNTKHKSDGSPVTHADTLINELIIRRIMDAYPDHGVIGEELSNNTEASSRWIVDPVDGTHPFTIGIPVATFSLAYMVDEEIKLGVVYEPITDKLFSAMIDGGAFCNDVRLIANDSKSLKSNTIILGSQFNSEQLVYSAGQVYDRAVGAGMKAYHIHSTAYGLMMVADGRAVASIVGNAKLWDIAASLVILREAGVTFTSLSGVSINLSASSSTIVASGANLHTEVLALITA